MKQALLNAGCIKKFESALKFELGHFYLYSMLANKMQMLGYFGAYDYFIVEREEEIGHYQKHISFLNDEGILPKLPTLVPETDSATSLKEAIQMAYDNELDLLKYYREMYNEEEEEYAEVGQHLLFFLETQRTAVGFYGDLLATMESEKNNPNINMIIDKKLKELA
jgi:ferritin